MVRMQSWCRGQHATPTTDTPYRTALPPPGLRHAEGVLSARREGHGGARAPAWGEGQPHTAAQVSAPHPSPLPMKNGERGKARLPTTSSPSTSPQRHPRVHAEHDFVMTAGTQSCLSKRFDRCFSCNWCARKWGGHGANRSARRAVF
jgi:hypothetical protein